MFAFQGRLLYQKIRDTSDLFRLAFGNFMITNYFTFVSYLTEAPYILFTERLGNEQFMMGFALSNGILWILGADFHSIVQDAIYLWTKSHIHDPNLFIVNRVLLAGISSEASSVNGNGIAISCKYHSLTYGSIGAVRFPIKY